MTESTHIHAALPDPARPAAIQSALWLQGITVLWMLVECSVALLAAKQARSVALLAFGSDSFVELMSAVVVLLQFGSVVRLAPVRATRISALLLYALSGVIALSSILALARGSQPETSALGIAITAAALLLMPIMAWLKRRKALALNNRAMAADAVQSATCAYLAAVTLSSLAANALFHIGWLDSVAALVAVPFLLIEAKKAWRGESCGCC